MKHNWEYKQFTDIATSITPRIKVDKSDYLLEGPVPIISQEESYISGYWDNLDDITPHNGPVIIFGDHSRVLKYVDCDFVVGADGVKIISPKDCICAKFLFHFLKWYNIPSLGYSRHFKLIKDATFPVPSIETQMQIVAELDKINETIADCRELLRNLDALAQSLFYDFFGDPVTNPKGWETSRFGELCKLSAGGDKPFDTQKEISKDFNIPIYSNGIENEGLYGYTSKPRITSPAITISGRGTLGVPFIRLKPFVPIIRLIVAIPSPVVNLTFLFYMIKLLKIGGKGAAIPQLTVPMVKDLLLPVPPLSLQEKFAARIEQIEEQKKAVEQTIAELQTLLDSRMDYWFN